MSWESLHRELDAWAEAGRTATFWWRDDDAVDVTPALERLIGLQRAQGAPLMLAVIPARAQGRLAARLAGESDIAVVQHGWAHANHAPVGRAKAELGNDRPVAYVLGELIRGRIVLDRLFDGGWLRVLVPPHNRIAPGIAAALAPAGYLGLSTYNPRHNVPRGLLQINSHIDLMNWTTRRFLGEAETLELAIRHLRARREGRVDAHEPTGLLTHHLGHDEDAWRFTEAFLAAIARHPAGRWADPRRLYAGAA